MQVQASVAINNAAMSEEIDLPLAEEVESFMHSAASLESLALWAV